jgi:hypothetical protein
MGEVLEVIEWAERTGLRPLNEEDVRGRDKLMDLRIRGFQS